VNRAQFLLSAALASPALRAVARRPASAGLAAAPRPETWEAARGEFALAPEFDAAVFSCREGVTKPDAALYLKVLEHLGVDARDALYVGDRADELHGAAAVGMTPLLFECGDVERQEWNGRRIASLAEVLDA